jgi:hypothetical protein
MLEKAYVRFRENIPDNANTYAAAEGFAQQGIPVVPFYGFGDLNLSNMPDLGPQAIVSGNVGDVWEVLRLLGRPIPPPLDYPGHLDWLMGRRFEYVTLAQVRALVERHFVKPVQQKLFGGFVFDPMDPRSRLAVAAYPEDTLCIIAEEVDFVSEYRCFIRDNAPVGVKHYRGDSFVALDKTTYNKAVKCCKGRMPAAYSLDLGVTADGRTLLVEANEGYALGSYGLNGLVYARFLEARWMQLVS